MAVDEALTKRFRALVEELPNLSEKRMMGGVCFMVAGNMIGGADRTKEGVPRLMFRVGKENVREAERLPGGQLMVQGKRLMKGFFFVNPEEVDGAGIRAWASLAISHALSLPPK